jgi:arylsulfatase A-like enzyme
MNRAKRISAAGLILSVVISMTACQRGGELETGTPDDMVSPGGEFDERPNILFIMADDMGYLDAGFFGSEIRTPNLDALATEGLRLTNFHAAPACQLTRAMLMSGTTNGEAGVTVLDDSLHADVAALPERLAAAGYHTYMAGKWNLGVAAEDGAAARGFENSYALMKAADNHLGHNVFPGSPPTTRDGRAAYRENGQPVDLPEGWFSSRIHTDKLMQYIDANTGDGIPWFGYLAFTAPHWPLQVPEDWIDRYAGRYEAGYNALLEVRYDEAKQLGILPEALTLDGFVSVAEPWDSLDEEERNIQRRSMEVYAAMVENMDMHVGRLIDFLDASGQRENTVIVFSSDNGAARETRAFRPSTVPRTDTDNTLENIGREGSFAALGPGWAEAAMAPYRGLKSSLYEGGTLVPAFVNYAAIADKGGIDRTYLTIMDLLPTFLGIAQRPVQGSEFQGRQVLPVRGNSFWGLATGASSTVQRSDNAVPWSVPTTDAQPRTTVLVQWPWKLYGERSNETEAELEWSLFNLEADPGERQDLALDRPELTSELAALWQKIGP